MPKLLRFVVAAIVAITLQQTATSQSLSVNTTGAVANASSILDVSSTSKGVLIPRMDKTQKNAIATPATGLLVYQTLPDSIGFHYYDGTKWIYLAVGSADSTSWKINGNSNIKSGNFLGTLNDSALRFRVRNTPSGIVDSASVNTALGFRSLSAISSGKNNTALGAYALRNDSSGTGNVAIGYRAAFSADSATHVVAIGADALYYNRNDSNVAVGYRAGLLVGFNYPTNISKEQTFVGTDAGQGSFVSSKNTAVGFKALMQRRPDGVSLDYNNGGRNTAIGDSAMAYAIGISNVAIGTEVLSRSDQNTFYNVAVGDSALGGALSTSGNVAIGYKTLSKQQGQGYNTAVGYFSQRDSSKNTYYNTSIGAYSMEYNRTGIYNTGLGLSTLRNADSTSYNTALGADAMYNHKKNGSNLAAGAFALRGDSSGYWNTAVGSEAMDRQGFDATARGTGFSNVAVGFRALRGAREAFENTAVGVGALESDSSGNYNTAVGRYSSFLNKRGDFNVSMGYRASNNADTASFTTAIGSYAGAKNKQNNNVTIGYAAGYEAGSSSTYNPKEITFVGFEAGRGAWASNKNTSLGFRALSNTDAGFGIYDYVTGRNTAIGDSAMAFSIGGSNVVVGSEALSNAGVAGTFNNVAIGDSAMGAAQSNSGALADNVAIGFRSLTQVKNQGNIAIGAYSGRKLANTIWNTAIGYHALETDTTGSENTVIGTSAFRSNANGIRNVSLGINTGYWSTSSQNTYLGSYAGEGISGRSTGGSNTALGYVALRSIRSGSQNVALGEYALYSDSTGSLNVSIGAGSMESHLRGNDNIAMGFWAGRTDTASTGAVYIGRDAGYNNQRSNIVAIGYQALLNNSLGLNAATQLDSAAYNTAVGFQAMTGNTKGGWNTALGYLTSRNNTTGFFNTAVGIQSLFANTTGSQNTALGTNALFSAVTANFNTAVGAGAGQYITGIQNTIVGAQAMAQTITTGTNNVAVGVGTLNAATSADNNIGIGTFALDANTTGDDNVGIGVNALTTNVAGLRNVAVGGAALSISTGNDNTAVGTSAGNGVTTGTFNSLIGSNTDVTTGTLTYATAIGADATVACSNCLVLGGNTATNRTKVGINKNNPTFYLDLEHPSGVGNGFGLHNSLATFGWELYQFSTSNLNFIYNGTSVGNINSVSGAYTATSDRRYKTNIKPMESILDRVMKLTPSRYQYIKNNPLNIQSIGFIAQDVEPLFPEVVSKQKSDEKNPAITEAYGLDYAGLSVVAIKAIQEQQKIIEDLKKKNEQLEKDMLLIKTKLGINN